MSDAENNDKPKQEYLNFSDFAEDDFALPGDKVNLNDILNIRIILFNFRIKPSKFKRENTDDCLTLQFEFPDNPGKKYIIFTGSSVLTRLVQKYKDRLPFGTTIKKVQEKGKTWFKFT
jgi:hypothetical protein